MKISISIIILLSFSALLFSAPGDLIWRYWIRSYVSSPCVSDGVVFVGSFDNYLYSLNCPDGTLKWRYKTGAEIWSSPCVSDGVVYVGSFDSYLYAINCSDRTLKWRYKTDALIYSSPCVSDGVVYIGSYYYLYAINCSDGTLKWRNQTGVDVRSSPCVSDGVVYVGDFNGYLYAINCSDGTLKWEYQTANRVWSSPCISEGVVYIGSNDHYLYAINCSDGTLKWRYQTDNEIYSSPCVSDGVVFVGSDDDYLYAINCSDGAPKWRYSVGSLVYSSPCVSDGVVYVQNGERHKGKEYIYSINCSNGFLVWRYETQGAQISSPCVSDGVVYIGSGGYDSGCFYAIETMEPGDTVIKVDTPSGGETWLIGSVQEIIWGSMYVDSVSIKYTTDAGNQWIDIAEVPAGPGIYQWTIPNTHSNSCLVEVTDLHGTTSDRSDSFFSIVDILDITSKKSSKYLPRQSFSASPNPFSTRLSVSLPSSGAIYSLTGQLIMKLDKGKHSLDTSRWREGVYIVKSGKETKRIIKI